MEAGPSGRRPVVAGIVAIVILVVVVGGVSLANKDDDITTSADTSIASQATDTTSDDTKATYRSGSYSASGNYSSPGGTEAVKVSLMLDGNTITDVAVTTEAASPTSEEYQNAFKSGYKSVVVGKNINDVKLSKVSGSSLTSQGFNAALQKIKDQAQSAS